MKPHLLALLLLLPVAPFAQTTKPEVDGPEGAVAGGPGEEVLRQLGWGLGLAVVLDAEGKEVLQYVAPAEFERRLRAPLLKVAALPAADPPR